MTTADTMTPVLPATPETASGAAVRVQRVVVPSEKSKAFFARLLARRQTPGNCVRCGHKNPQPKYKTCPRCLEAVKRRKLNNKPAAQLEAMLRRISSLELAVANLQLHGNRRYANGYNAGLRKANKKAARYLESYPSITRQELSTMNHAYDRQ